MDAEIKALERRAEETISPALEGKLLESLPGVGESRATVIALEAGDVRRFPGPENLASHAGMVPMVQSSSGKIRHGKTWEDVNHYLKWADIAAAKVIARYAKKNPYPRASQLYLRLREKKGQQKAVVAMGRHLAEATWWGLTTRRPYQEQLFRKRTGVMRA